ncbi:MAG TPA: cyclic nucleotide-binding domain-containing protein [Solirubrobacteraceae bacterium]|nr:cyclic nucleotide-binding domain-containing protein [Solirubrobacteraceae bacterium]
MSTVADLLRDAPFFTGLRRDWVELVAGCGSNVHFKAGELIFREGDTADLFYLLRHGSVALEAYAPTSGQLVIETIDAGEMLGWSWLFPPYRWHFDAHATTVVRATAFDGACLRGKCDADPALGYELTARFAQTLIERLQWTRLRLLDVYGNVGAR